MKTYTIDDVRDAIERVDDMLRTIGFAANAGACQCTRCAKAHTASGKQPAGASAPSPLSGGSLVDKPAPAPRAPRPGGNAVTVKDAVSAAIEAGLSPKQFRALAERVADEIEF